MKLCVSTCASVLGLGIVDKINVHCKNYAIVQNKLAMTIKQFILTITGNAEMSKEVLHKQVNYICQDKQQIEEAGLYSGKNYAIPFIKHISRLRVNLLKAVDELEDRFLETADKDFLTMIIESMVKGQQVSVKKVMPS